MACLELTQIQGNILRGYRSEKAQFIFLACPNAPAGRAFLAELIPHLHNAADLPPPTTVNVAITHAGLQALGVSGRILADLPAAFREPIGQRAARLLDDTGASAPDQWDPGLGTGQCHILVTIRQCNAHIFELAAPTFDVMDRIAAHGMEVVHTEDTAVLEGAREHFGWADGLAQPEVEGAPGTPKDGGGTPERDETWRPLKAGEFILGYPDEDGPYAGGPSAPLLRNGTYMVYRKLRQDAFGFRRHLYEQAQRYRATLPDVLDLTPDQSYELLGAKVVGRWRDGRSIALPENQSPPQQSGSLRHVAVAEPSNNFRYSGDLSGSLCPVGAHIRRTNPRDALQGGGPTGLMSRRHRIIRRGMPYGAELPEYQPGQTDDGQERGLIFICFNADLERQFELIQRDWCNDGNAFRLGAEQDFLLHRTPTLHDDGRLSNDRFTVTGERPYVATSLPDFVVTRGCEYLLMPGIDALGRLVQGDFDEFDDGRTTDERNAIAEVIHLTKVKLERDFPQGTPMLRDQHAKPHGCVRARFIVAPDLPPWIRHGIFAEPATYDAWIRFSSSFSPPRPDSTRDAHGMAIKILGVAGDKVLESERHATTQDFILANSKVFFCRNPSDYVELASKMVSGRFIRFFFPGWNPTIWRLRELVNMLGATQRRVENPLRIQYWSQTPSALGPHAVKYTAMPRASNRPSTVDRQAENYLELAMAEELSSSDACFDFMVQLQADEHATPVEDPTIPWSERVSPFNAVATIRIPRQEFGSDEQKQFAENLSFTPWHSLPAHRPLGGINRVRRATYEAISRFRHERNGEPRAEPSQR